MALPTPQSKKSTTKKTALAKKSPTKTSAAKSEIIQPVNDETRYKMISEAAYLIAEQRGFQGIHDMDDWLQAEAEVDARFAARH